MAKGRQFQSQISAESALRFQPQYDALAALLKQAVRDREAGLTAAETVRSGLTAGAQVAAPQAQASLQSASTFLDNALQGVPLSGLVGQDVAATRARLADQQARTGAELAARSSDAAAGYAGAVRQAQQQYSTDKSKIADQLSSLSGQEGTYGASRLAELLAEDKKMRHDTNQQTRQQNFTAGQNRAGRAVTKRGQDLSHEDRVAAAKKAKAKSQWAAPEKQGAFEDQVSAAIAQAKKLQAAGRDRHETAGLLRDGRPGQQVTDPQSGQTLNVPGVKSYGELVASVAADAVYDGHISGRNIERVHQRKYKVQPLGIPTKPPTTTARKPRRTPASAIPVIGGLTAGP